MSAEEVGRLARRLTSVLYIQHAALGVLRHPDSSALAPGRKHEVGEAAGLVLRQDGSSVAYDWQHHVDAARGDEAVAAELERAFVVSALLVLAEQLAKENYFDRAPVLEMVRHLRNGVAHGNAFHFHDPSVLVHWPAHTRDAACRSPLGSSFEITADCEGRPVLFDFMAPGDVIDVVASVGSHLLGQHPPRDRT